MNSSLILTYADSIEKVAHRITNYANDKRNGLSGETVQEMVYDTTEIFRAAHALRQFAWISVEDRLPEDERHVLAATRNKKGDYNIVKAYYCHDLGMWAAGMNSNVTHWMPLPEPPEGGKQ